MTRQAGSGKRGRADFVVIVLLVLVLVKRAIGDKRLKSGEFYDLAATRGRRAG